MPRAWSAFKLSAICLAGTLVTGAQTAPENAEQLLSRGTELIASHPAEAVKVLERAVRLDPERAEVHLQLGRAYRAIGDEADASAELKEAASRMPESAAAHNELGMALFRLGKREAAAAEFREAARLAPGDPNVRSNLQQALPPQAAPETSIRVDVRQVVVPVVVLDREGHHVTGLTQNDFRILEDGAEQKITAFSVESAGLQTTGIAPAPIPSRRAAQTAAPRPEATHQAVRRTYLVVIDTLHTSFNDFVSAREALVKLFQDEKPGDSQYVVVAIGASSEMLLNTTSDPGAVLRLLRDKKVQRSFLEGQQGGLAQETERFRRELTATKGACVMYQKTGDRIYQMDCQTGMQRAPSEARQIAELDRTLTVGFLRQFGVLVQQLARASDRRTIILISDGFQIVPGREGFDLLRAFFPGTREQALGGVDRMQSELEPILRTAALSNITIDTIDSRGLYGQAGFDASHSANPVEVDTAAGQAERNSAAGSGNTLREIADATGGTAFHDNNNLLAGLQRAFADGRDYYVLSYASPNPAADGKFRAITVQVRKPGVTVNAKRGYWADGSAQ